MTVEEQNTAQECVPAVDNIQCAAPTEDHSCGHENALMDVTLCDGVQVSDNALEYAKQEEQIVHLNDEDVALPTEPQTSQDQIVLVPGGNVPPCKCPDSLSQQVLLELGWEPEHKIYCLNYTFPEAGNCRINMTLQELRNLRNELNLLIDSTTSNA